MESMLLTKLNIFGPLFLEFELNFFFFLLLEKECDTNLCWDVGTCSVAYMENLYLMFGFEGAL